MLLKKEENQRGIQMKKKESPCPDWRSPNSSPCHERCRLPPQGWPGRGGGGKGMLWNTWIAFKRWGWVSKADSDAGREGETKASALPRSAPARGWTCLPPLSGEGFSPSPPVSSFRPASRGEHHQQSPSVAMTTSISLLPISSKALARVLRSPSSWCSASHKSRSTPVGLALVAK